MAGWLVGFPLLWLAALAAAVVATPFGFGPLGREGSGSFCGAAVEFLNLEVTASLVAFLGAIFIWFWGFVLWTLVLRTGVLVGVVSWGTDLVSWEVVAVGVLIHAGAQLAALVAAWRT